MKSPEPTPSRFLHRCFSRLPRAGAAFAIAILALLAVLAGTSAPAHAADAALATPAALAETLDGVRQDLAAIQAALPGKPADADLVAMRDRALADAGKADDAATALAPALARVKARQAELGTPPAGAPEARDIITQRAQITKMHGDLDDQIKLANLLSVEAKQLAAQISVLRRDRFQASMGQRTPSILAPAFWNELRGDVPEDIARLRALSGQLRATAGATPAPVWAVIVLAALGLLILRVYAGRVLFNLTATKVPPGRLRRSLHAVTLVLLSVATPASIVLVLLTGLRWTAGLPDETDTFMLAVLGLVAFGGYVDGLGHALLMPGRPSWRLLPLSDPLARRMRGFPVTLALVLVGAGLAARLAVLINVGLATEVAINCIVALLVGVTITFWLLRGARLWRKLRAQAARGEQPAGYVPGKPAHELWLRGIIIVQWLILTLSLLSLLTGYVAFGSFVVKQVAWTLIVLSSSYLLAVLIDDACTAIGSAAQRADASSDAQAPPPRIRDQAAVLLSGVARLLIALVALMLLAAPFGEGPLELLHRADQLHDGISIGEIAIKPGSVFQALLVLGLALLGLRVLKRWLVDRFLPTTSLDPGMQTSTSTLFGYAGGVVAVALALSALGIGLERIAWVASALSVGIGFGLQAVVQNFVSGLILLAERPVKVGDWVSLGGVEGDIRRINVRATEIQMGDRSTVIVPNSQFITSTVRNVTHTNPLGLVQIKLPVPLGTDAEQARKLLLEAFQANPGILDDPAPNVQLDGIDNNNLIFNATGFASSPRLAYGIRSDLLFDILKRLGEAEISISRQPTTMLIGTPSALAPVQTATDTNPTDQPGQQTLPIPPHT
ncbi:mechanosensitive ion channel family protein [Oxalobacteraceae bacterium CAVE-383]|nr:mechanosensitive ion channel family protein [Oxalobacteraceae bacterium CAVE-383]